MQHRRLLAACLAAATAALLLSAASAQPQCPQHGWTHRAHSCYKWFSEPRYWFQAEQRCLSHRAHLASIGSEQENRLVGRLSHCRDAWIGRFGTDLDQLADPRSYRWTDGSDAVRFERHNFSQLDSVHKPLIRSDGEWWLNSLYHERHPFVCEVSANSTENSSSGRCPSGWSLHNNQCYVMPHFEANFNEANFYCQRNSSHLVSVLTRSELDLVNKLSFGIDSCESPDRLDSVWIGLIKLNPCFPDSSGRELCYQWTDFSGKHDQLPAWETGHPDRTDWTVNCVTLTAGRLRSGRCHSRHRFVCKSAASNGTDGGVTSSPDGGVTSSLDGGVTSPDGGVTSPDGGVTSSPDGGVTSSDGGVTSSPDGGVTSSPDGGVTSSPDGGVTSSPDGGVTSSPDGGVTSSPDGSVNPSPPSVEGLVAAFDFRRGLDNLVDPRTFAIYDQFGVERSAEDGACFKVNTSRPYGYREFYNVGAPVAFNESIWNAAEWTMYLRMKVNGIGLRFLNVPFDISSRSSDFSFHAGIIIHTPSSVVLYSNQLAPETARNYHYNHHNFNGSPCLDSWCDMRLAMKDWVLDPASIGQAEYSYYRNRTSSWPEPGQQQLQLGIIPGYSVHSDLCVRCFGVARRQLSVDEVNQTMAFYCP